MNQDSTVESISRLPSQVDDIHYFSIVDATWCGYAGVVFWGGLYGCLWAGIIFIVAAVYVIPAISFDDFLTGFFGFLLTVVVFGFVGMMAAGFMGILTTSAICLFNFTMNNIWSPVTASKIAGGSAAFLATCSATVVCLEEGDLTSTVISYLLGPTLAMFFGHIGAARMAARQIKLHYQRQGVTVDKLWIPTPIEDLSKFNIRQMLVLTAWFAAIFAIFSAVSRSSIATTTVLASYFVLQTIVYFIGEAFVRGFERKNFAAVTSSKDDTLGEAAEDQARI